MLLITHQTHDPDREEIRYMKTPNDSRGWKVGSRRLALPVLPGGIEGGLVGKVGGSLLAAAAPITPRGDGALSIWACPISSETGRVKSWREAKVTVPVWAASARWEDRLIVVGGMLGEKPVSRMSVLSTDGSGAVKSNRLPDLPQPLVGAGAAMIGKTLYVIGGVSSLDPAIFEKKLWKLHFTDGDPDKSWLEGEGFPDSPRAFSAVTAQYGMLCVFGGIQPGLRVSNETWVYRPTPIEATSFIGWKRVSDLPHPSARASVVALGQAGVMLAGGIQEGTIQGIPPANDSTGKDGRPWLYHTITDAWCPFDKELPITESLALKMDPGVWRIGREGTHEVAFPRMMRNLAVIDYIVVICYFVLLASIVITLLVKLSTPLHWSTYMPIAIFSCMMVGYLCSLFTPQTKDLEGLTVFTPKKSTTGEP